MPDPRTILDAAFAATVVALVVLHVAVYVRPLALVRFNALPWAFRLEFNTDLDFQAVTYTTVHETWQARLTHITLPLEYLAWCALLWMAHPLALVAATIGVIAVLSRVVERRFALIAGIFAIVLSAVAAAVTTQVDRDLLAVSSKVLLLSAPLLRFIGHAFDPIPPWVGIERDAFVPLRESRMGWRLPFIFVAGWLSECAASLPFRLFWVQLFWALQRVGYRPQTLRPWSEMAVQGAEIRTRGWSAFEKTGRLFVPMVPRA